MLVLLVGSPCAGKERVADFLVAAHAFRRVRVRAPCCAPPPRTPTAEAAAAGSQSGAGSGGDVSFADPAHLLDYATAHWTQNLVCRDIACARDFAVGFDKRPWVLLVAVDAPLGLRWKRHQLRRADDAATPDLAAFVAADDTVLYGATCVSLPPLPHLPPSLSQAVQPTGALKTSGPATSLQALVAAAGLRVLNAFDTLDELHAHLASLDLPSHARLRPSWDTYFLSLCTLASLRSNCMKRRVGAVLVRSNRVLSTGYNGTPRGLRNCSEGGCARCNAGAEGGTKLDECLCLHAEENALLECGRERGGAEGTVLYCNTCPCLRCAVKIVQVGIQEVVYELNYAVDGRTAEIFRDAGVKLRQCTP